MKINGLVVLGITLLLISFFSGYLLITKVILVQKEVVMETTETRIINLFLTRKSDLVKVPSYKLLYWPVSLLLCSLTAIFKGLGMKKVSEVFGIFLFISLGLAALVMFRAFLPKLIGSFFITIGGYSLYTLIKKRDQMKKKHFPE